ncbi:Hsp70 family protein [Phytomonospora endophytica]|uniref:Molecular chaperone DnaK (HSP70) n=1 Tax=Phytomonospora endophytica TaxID=714109 RepID=A0A841FML9_9ACTN|nr:Hsp70 family protein [Phytomonospora endophytica]MBB6036153.1 molecular chaperone DnaK (HSP70) [Phytomonospora endophytica]GIG67056.1 hypothetical protein Pen01_33510 [Phytomonospora endophytica]
MSPVALGVDFGTSHTVAVWRRDDGPAVPLLFDGSPLLPSGVYADTVDGLRAGRAAANAARVDPARFEPNPKRRVDDGSLLLGEDEFAVVDVIAAVLTRVRAEAVRVAGAVDAVVLTHPAAWGPRRRLVLEDAAENAGLAGATLLPEPVAAARYFTTVLGRRISAGQAVVVFDLGGGTFDASVVTAGGGGFEVAAVDGLESLGGVDVDQALIELLARVHGEREGWSRLMSPESPRERAARRLFTEDVRMAKEALSTDSRAELPIPLLDVPAMLTREELEAVTGRLLEGAVATTRAVVRAAKLTPERIAGVFLVGGASRMPLVATMLHRALGVAPTVIEQPELVVAQGAAVSVPVAAPVVAPPPAPAPVRPPPVAPRKPKRRLDWRWRAAIALAILLAASILVTQLTKVN